jgi:hypothetical protein
MNITNGVITPETDDEIIAYGREIYRRAQQADWPQDGVEALRFASSRLWTETEVCARVRADGFPVTPGRRARARRAAGELLQAIHSYCGPAAAAKVSGQDGSVAA